MSELSRDPSSSEKEGQGDADVGRDEHLTIKRREDDGESQKDGVAGLIGGEAVIVGKRGRVLYAGHNGEEQKKRG